MYVSRPKHMVKRPITIELNSRNVCWLLLKDKWFLDLPVEFRIHFWSKEPLFREPKLIFLVFITRKLKALNDIDVRTFDRQLSINRMLSSEIVVTRYLYHLRISLQSIAYKITTSDVIHFIECWILLHFTLESFTLSEINDCRQSIASRKKLARDLFGRSSREAHNNNINQS